MILVTCIKSNIRYSPILSSVAWLHTSSEYRGSNPERILWSHERHWDKASWNDCDKFSLAFKAQLDISEIISSRGIADPILENVCSNKARTIYMLICFIFIIHMMPHHPESYLCALDTKHGRDRYIYSLAAHIADLRRADVFYGHCNIVFHGIQL